MSENQTRERSEDRRRVVIVGGVAGGASCAARLRRLDENAEIVMVERGPHISFANCGLPYHIGGVIEDREKLLIQTPESFERRFDVDVRTLTEAVDIDPEARNITLRDVDNGQQEGLDYDDLVLSPGASPFLPPIPGVELDEVYSLRTIPDMDFIIEACDKSRVEHVTVVGGGFIGVEVAENLIHRGIDVTLVEMNDQLMPNLDREMAASVAEACIRNGVELCLEMAVTAIEEAGGKLRIHLDDQATYQTDMVVMAVGVRPETELAEAAGLELGEWGGIVVDEMMRTSKAHIYAIGDAVEVIHRVTGDQGPMALAGPANRQGRLVADVICGRNREYLGPVGTSIIKVFDTVAACTGLSQSQARRREVPHRVAWVTSKSHASYYPGAEPVTLKVVFDEETGLLLGAQAFGKEGVDKRIDVLATAVAAGMTVDELEQLDLAYAPPFSSAKDPVNHVGAVADGILRADHPAASWEEVIGPPKNGRLVLDVRTPEEFDAGTIPGAVNIPLDELRERIDELPENSSPIVLCKEGLRGYLATRILVQNGHRPRNLLGGYELWRLASAHVGMG